MASEERKNSMDDSVLKGHGFEPRRECRKANVWLYGLLKNP